MQFQSNKNLVVLYEAYTHKHHHTPKRKKLETSSTIILYNLIINKGKLGNISLYSCQFSALVTKKFRCLDFL